jgi:hypothetical protein
MKRWQCIFAIVMAGLLSAAPAWAEGNKNAVKQDVKVPQVYMQLPRMAVPVPVAGTEAYRQLEVELWIYMPNPEIQLKLKPQLSTIADHIRDKLKKNPAGTYESAEEGPTAIKEIARDAVEDVIGKDAGEDVLIKSLLLR